MKHYIGGGNIIGNSQGT